MTLIPFAGYAESMSDKKMNKLNRRPTLDRPATYQIKVPGHLDTSWTEWNGRMTLTVAKAADGSWTTTLTGVIDQAALHGMLRRLYGLGLPLISVVHVRTDPANTSGILK